MNSKTETTAPRLQLRELPLRRRLPLQSVHLPELRLLKATGRSARAGRPTSANGLV